MRRYATTDYLGSPRIITDQLGQVKARRDFMPFGEELFINIGARSNAIGYGTSADNVRQKFTGYQKDDETQLDFAEARMYENRHGRFTAVDPLLASGKSSNPKTFNRYVYVMNNPLVLTDPTGLQAGTVPDEENEVLSIDAYWDRAKNEVGSWAGYLQSLGISAEQMIRYYAYSNGGEKDFEARTSSSSPVVRPFGGVLNPTTGPSITAFNNAIDNFNQQVIQRTPLLSNLVNAQMAGLDGNYAGFGLELGMFGVDLGTSIFTGGTGGTLRRGGQEAIEVGAERLLLGAGDQVPTPEEEFDLLSQHRIRLFIEYFPEKRPLVDS